MARSKVLFGSPHRLPVALLVSLADAGELYAARIAEAAQIDRKEAVREFEHLQSADLLVPVSREIRSRSRGRPAQFMERRDDDAWGALQALGERFRQQDGK
jgi:predicted ArsR family transcriptional regulator